MQTRINIKHLFYVREICGLNSACNYRSELSKIKYLFSISLRLNSDKEEVQDIDKYK